MGALPATIVRLESSLHWFYPCFWSTALTLWKTWRQPPKFQRRNTLLKYARWVKEAKSTASTPPRQMAWPNSPPTTYSVTHRDRSWFGRHKPPRRRGWDSCRCTTRNERYLWAPSRKRSARRVRIPPMYRWLDHPHFALGNRSRWILAERVGFEPTDRVNGQRFSRPPHSTTLAPLHLVAEREGFEPSVEFPQHTLSRRAPSAARSPLQQTVYSKNAGAGRPSGHPYRFRRRLAKKSRSRAPASSARIPSTTSTRWLSRSSRTRFPRLPQ